MRRKVGSAADLPNLLHPAPKPRTHDWRFLEHLRGARPQSFPSAITGAGGDVDVGATRYTNPVSRVKATGIKSTIGTPMSKAEPLSTCGRNRITIAQPAPIMRADFEPVNTTPARDKAANT